MPSKSLTFLTLLAMSAVGQAATVIKTDAEVTASINVKTSSDARNFQVFNIGGFVNCFGYSRDTNVNNGSGSSSTQSLLVRSYASVVGVGLPGIDWSYYTSTSTWNQGQGLAGANAQSSVLYTTFKPLAVVQYLDNNNNGKYDFGEEYEVDSTSGTLLLDGYRTSVTKTQDGTAWVVSHQSNNFGFRYSVQNREVSNQGVNVDANSVKVDVYIRPVSNAQAQGKVALLASFSTVQSDSSVGGSVNNGNVTVTGSNNVKYSRNGLSGGFSWSGSAATLDRNGNQGSTKITTDVLTVSASASITINGKTILSANALSNLPKIFVFNFDATNPSEIYWDPTLGPNSASSIMISITAIFFALALLF